MLHKITKYVLALVSVFCTVSQQASGQAQLVLDGGIINISGGASLVLANPAATALVRKSGHIISEGEKNTIQWHIGASTGTYSVPWGFGSSNYLPVNFKKDNGSGAGIFVLSTYRTGWKNSDMMPTGITNLNNGSSNNSEFMLDRFWQISSRQYTQKPSITELTFTYMDEEHTVQENFIAESGLKAQRWNDDLKKWGDYAPAGTVNTETNTVSIPAVAAADLHNWWVLTDQIKPLPVELLYFKAKPESNLVKLTWATAAETNSNAFIVEKSHDAKVFEFVASISGAGNSSTRLRYEALDKNPTKGTSYYRLKQVDMDGSWHYSSIQSVDMSATAAIKHQIFPNPVTAGRFIVETGNLLNEKAHVVLYNLQGKQVITLEAETNTGIIEVITGATIKPGAYILQLTTPTTLVKEKVLIR